MLYFLCKSTGKWRESGKILFDFAGKWEYNGNTYGIFPDLCGDFGSGGTGMTEDIKDFVVYLREVKRTSANTEVSYQRDLLQMASYLREKGITEVSKVTRTSLNSYILHLEKEGKATTTISRVLASMKAFFHYELSYGRIRRDPAELIKAPENISLYLARVFSLSPGLSVISKWR